VRRLVGGASALRFVPVVYLRLQFIATLQQRAVQGREALDDAV
jgi:hypothetical protein